MKNVMIKIIVCCVVVNTVFAAALQLPKIAREYDRDQTEQLKLLGQGALKLDQVHDVLYKQRWCADLRSKAMKLIDAKADPDTRCLQFLFLDSPLDLSPSLLCLAMKKNDPEFAQFLLDHSADPNFNTYTGKPLSYVTKTEQVDFLIARGAVPMDDKNFLHAMTWVMNQCDPALVVHCCNAGGDPNGRDKQGNTPLHRLCLMGGLGFSEELVTIYAKTLLLAGADASLKNNAGKTPFDLLREAQSGILGKASDDVVETIVAFHDALPAIQAARAQACAGKPFPAITLAEVQ
jgi:hypothetical protein